MRARDFAYSILDRVEPEPLVFDGRLITTLVVLLLAGLVAFSGPSTGSGRERALSRFLERLLGRRCIPGMKTRVVAMIASSLLLVSACAEVGAQETTESTQAEKVKETKEKVAEAKSETKTSKVGKKTFVWPESCPVTVLGKNSFTPASEAPDGPPKLYDAVWYGTPELYTMINPEGQSSLNRWLGGEKTFWWSENFSISNEPNPDIQLTGQLLDGKTATYEATQTTHGMRDDIGDFMLVGVTLPEAGCWELTATYEGASLSYVIWVEPKKG